MSAPENPLAFPSGDKAAFPTSTFEPGMTLRDWFAGQALIGAAIEDARADGSKGLAAAAYRIADAMLTERSSK